MFNKNVYIIYVFSTMVTLVTKKDKSKKGSILTLNNGFFLLRVSSLIFINYARILKPSR